MRLYKITAIVLMLTSGLFAQNRITEFTVGLLRPSDAQSGFYGGVNFGRMVDEKIGVSVGVHVYRSSYTKKSQIGEKNPSGQIVISTTQYELDQSATLIPLFFQLHYVSPVTNSLDLRITGGVGYELLWNSVQNYVTSQDATQFFSAFSWNLGAGLSMPISRAADFYGEAFYHGGVPSRDAGKTEAGLPVSSQIDMSGLGIRLGIRLYGFGF